MRFGANPARSLRLKAARSVLLKRMKILLNNLLEKIGVRSQVARRAPISVFLLDDDKLRHQWFAKHFEGDFLDVAEDVPRAIELLSQNDYDALFLDHDLLPEHYEGKRDDERTGYAVARWLAENPHIQPSSTIYVHTRNADGAMRMVELMRESGRLVEYLPYPLLIQKIKYMWK